jgi:hypothetical protein
MKGRTELEHPEWVSACCYQEYVVAFLDILNFSQLVYDTKNNVIFAGLFNALSTGVDQNGFLLKNGFDGLKTSVISDSIVLSLNVNTDKLFEKLNRLLFMVVTSFAEENILVRGGISKGLLYHQDSIVFGPALVQAYHLEDQYANYPRCIIDKDVIEGLVKDLTPDDADLADNFTEDLDGFLYFDVYNLLCRNSDHDPEYSVTLQRLHDVIVSNLNKFGKPSNNKENRILDKYLWCKRALNFAIKTTGLNTHLLVP